MKIRLLLLVMGTVGILSACGESTTNTRVEGDKSAKATKTDSQATTLPSNHPNIESVASSSTTGATNRGLVKEVLSGGGYTYAAVDVGNKVIWIAGPGAKIQVGEKIAWNGGSLMTNFTSSSLNRTFENIYFVTGFVKASQETINKGVVAESIPSAGYVYIRVEAGGKFIWLAAPETPISNGSTISWRSGALMRNFMSNTLKRRFEEIIFIDKVTVEGNS